MKIILIMKNIHKEPTRVIVALRVKELSDHVDFLLKEHKEKEAFELLRTKAERLCYVPVGHRLEKYFPALVESELD